MSNLRKEARGRDCQARIAVTCNHDSETVVLHHVRINSGLGLKPNDALGCWACEACHAAIHASPRVHRLDELEGMYRTIEILIKEGKIKC